MEMREKFDQYNLELQEVADRHAGGRPPGQADRGDPDPVAARQIAQEQIETYGRQQMAATKERELREAEAAPSSSARSPNRN